jgi:hypothetical protein
MFMTTERTGTLPANLAFAAFPAIFSPE